MGNGVSVLQRPIFLFSRLGQSEITTAHVLHGAPVSPGTPGLETILNVLLGPEAESSGIIHPEVVLHARFCIYETDSCE